MEAVMQAWFSGPLGAALVRLFNMSAAAAVLICVVVLLRALLRRAPKWTRGILWAIVAVQLVCPVSLRSPLSVYGVLPRSDAVKSDQVELFRTGGGSEKPLLTLDTPQIAGYAPAAPTPTPVPTASPTSDALPAAEVAAPAPQTQVQTGPSVYLPTAGAVWLAGAALMLLYALLSLLALRRRVSASVPLEDKSFRLCDAIDTPFILGILRPRVYLPSGLSEAQRSAVLAHETAHLRRRDHWWKPLGWLLLAVHWFNPLVWLAYVLLCRDIELACDEKAVRAMDGAARADYSQALLDCAAPRTLLRVCPLAFGEVGVKARIKAILNYKKPAFWIIVAAVAVCVVVAVCFLTRPGPIRTPDPAAVMPTSEPTPTPYPTAAPSPTPTGSAMIPDFSNAEIYYLDEAFYDPPLSPALGFYILIDWDGGMFQFYESPISSNVGIGQFDLDGEILTVRDVWGQSERVNRFRVADDKLIWIAEGSDNFHFVTLTDGATFSAAVTPTPHPTEPPEPVPTGQPAAEPTGWPAVDPDRSSVYWLDDGFYGDDPFHAFYITLDTEAGTFQYYETPLSSFFGFGRFERDSDILTIDDSGDGTHINRFRLSDDGETLVWLAEGSDNFHFVPLTDGATFSQKRYTLRSGVYEGQYFSIRIDAEAGSFTYSEAEYSSHISTGLYGLEDGVLTLDDAWPTVSGEPSVRRNRFRVEEDRLVWIEDGSDNFVFVTLTDGASFRRKDAEAPLRRMTMDDVRALAAKGDALTWEDLAPFAGEDVGSGLYIYHFPIDEQYLLSVSDGKLTGTPQRVVLIRADESGAFRSIDIRTQDVDAFLVNPADSMLLTVQRGTEDYFACPLFLHSLTWSDEAHTWLTADGVPTEYEIKERLDEIPTVPLSRLFHLCYGTGASPLSTLRVYSDAPELIRSGWPGSTARNWLAPGTYYCAVDVAAPQGRYVKEADGYEQSAYRCVFRLLVPEDTPAPFTPEAAQDLVKAELHVAWMSYPLKEEADLAKLEGWLRAAEPAEDGADCRFEEVMLYLTLHDGSMLSLCPAEDGGSFAFSNGTYYRIPVDSTEIFRLFGNTPVWSE